MSGRIIAVTLALAAALLARSVVLDGRPSSPAGALEARVVKVVDGDTIHVLLGGRDERVRYIGVDTPVLWSRLMIPSASTEIERR